jgi:hypothetical protein
MEDRDRQVEKASPIVQVAIELGFKVRGNMARCFRGDRHADPGEATLFFNVARNSFFCKICSDVGGGVADLVSQFKGWDRGRALEWLAHRIDFDRETRARYSGKGRKKG